MQFTRKQGNELFTIMETRLYITDDPDYDREEYRLIKRIYNKVQKSDNVRLYQDEKEYLKTWIPLFITMYKESKINNSEDIQALEEILDKLENRS